MTEPGAFKLEVQSRREFINLRGDPGQASFLQAAARALGQELPSKPNSVDHGRLNIYWMGPDEWLVAGEGFLEQGLPERLEASLAGVHASVNDLSGGMVALQLTGSSVREVLSAGCPLDLDPSVFTFGDCAQSGLAKAAVLMAPSRNPEGMELFVRRSFSDYVMLWLADVAGRVESLSARPQEAM